MSAFAKPENALKRAEGEWKFIPPLLRVNVIFSSSKNGFHFDVHVLYIST